MRVCSWRRRLTRAQPAVPFALAWGRHPPGAMDAQYAAAEAQLLQERLAHFMGAWPDHPGMQHKREFNFFVCEVSGRTKMVCNVCRTGSGEPKVVMLSQDPSAAGSNARTHVIKGGKHNKLLAKMVADGGWAQLPELPDVAADESDAHSSSSSSSGGFGGGGVDALRERLADDYSRLDRHMLGDHSDSERSDESSTASTAASVSNVQMYSVARTQNHAGNAAHGAVLGNARVPGATATTTSTTTTTISAAARATIVRWQSGVLQPVTEADKGRVPRVAGGATELAAKVATLKGQLGKAADLVEFDVLRNRATCTRCRALMHQNLRVAGVVALRAHWASRACKQAVGSGGVGAFLRPRGEPAREVALPPDRRPSAEVSLARKCFG